MASRRMFSKRIVSSARFLKMPVSTQCLYFHLGLHADDDGIVEAYTVMNLVGASEDDLRILVAKKFVCVLNDDLVAYIMDWNENNNIRADRKIDSIYQDLLLQILPDVQLKQKKKRADAKVVDIGQPMDNQLTTNGQPMDGIGKDRLGKDRLGKDRLGERENTPTPITHILGKYKNVYLTEEQLQSLKTEYSDYEQKIERLSEYMASSGKTYENHYATLCLWAKEDAAKPKGKKNGFHNFHQRSYNYGSFEQDIVKKMAEKKQNPPKTAAEDESIRERAEALKKQFA